MLDLRGVEHGEPAAAQHLDAVIRVDEGGGVLVQADAGSEGILGQGGQEPAQPVALTVAAPLQPHDFDTSL